MRFHKVWLALAAVIMVDATLAGAQSKKLRPLRIALPSHAVSSTPIYMARSLGIFEGLGFEPQILVLEPRAALAALLTGDLDFYTAAGTTGRAALRGVPVRVVMVSANRSDLCVVAAKDFTSVEQLRGKTFGGYTAQASANIVLIELLRRKGLRPDDYKILNIGRTGRGHRQFAKPSRCHARDGAGGIGRAAHYGDPERQGDSGLHETVRFDG